MSNGDCFLADISEKYKKDNFMINTLIKHNNKVNNDLKNILENIYLLPNWEKIASFMLFEKKFFISKSQKFNLFRKFSSKNMLEKFEFRTLDDNVCAKIDLKVYKDSVYIINIDVQTLNFADNIIKKLVQISAEKALYNTSDKQVKINLSLPLFKMNKIKQILLNLGFVSEEQSKYEKKMFGETLTLNVEKSVLLQKQIKQNPILINK